MQETWVWSLGQEDPTCCGATKPGPPALHGLAALDVYQLPVLKDEGLILCDDLSRYRKGKLSNSAPIYNFKNPKNRRMDLSLIW